MRNLLLLAPVVAAGCWPYIPRPVPVESEDPVEQPQVDDTTTPVSACADGPNNTGPWAKHPISEAGIGQRGNAYPFDAGVETVMNQAFAATTRRPVELPITNAIVTAVDDTTTSLTATIADAYGSVVLFQLPVEFPPSSVLPGDRVNVLALEVYNYFGVPEVTDAVVQLVDGGDNVYVEEHMDGRNLNFDNQPLQLVEVWGELVSGRTECGGFDCFDLDFGANKTITFRAPAGEVGRGDCVHVIAPLWTFDGETQLGADHPDWYRTY